MDSDASYDGGTTTHMGKLLKPREVGKLLEVDGSTVRGWVKSGRLPAFITPGGQYRIDPQAVEDLLAKIGRTVPQPEVAA